MATNSMRKEVSGINDLDGLRDALRLKDELRAKQKAIALTLLEQCKGEGMTVADVVAICEIATAKAKATTLHDGLAL